MLTGPRVNQGLGNRMWERVRFRRRFLAWLLGHGTGWVSGDLTGKEQHGYNTLKGNEGERGWASSQMPCSFSVLARWQILSGLAFC